MTDEQPKYTGEKPRTRRVELEWGPIEYRGRSYGAITVKRLTTREVADFIEAIKDKDREGAKGRFPIFVDDAGEPVPAEVMDALDEDDMDRLNEVVLDFLPRRFRTLGASSEANPDASAPAAGEATAPSSSA